MSGPIERLREVSERCLAGKALGAELADWLGQSLQGYLSRRYQTVEDALGLRFPQGGVPWWREEAIRHRDAALRELADRFLPDLSPCAQARQIYSLAIRYAASTWRHDRVRREMPDDYRKTPKQCLWRAFTSGAAMPIGERQLRNILAK